jgi:hypothetical protein
VPKAKQASKKTPNNTLVRFDFESCPAEYHRKYPFTENEVLLFLGEVQHMGGHCVVATKDGRVVWGYHTENFVVIPKDEV